MRSKYRSIGLLFVLALVFALVPAVAFAAQGFSGVVKDGTTGYPIPFAHVKVFDGTVDAFDNFVPVATGDAAYDGTYSIDTDAGDETFWLEVGQKSYVTSESPDPTSPDYVLFTVDDGAFNKQDVVLEREPNFEQPIYRFFNMAGGVHFYTADNSEFINVYKNLPQYKYDGIGYSIPDGEGFSPYRDGADGEGLMNMNDVVLQRFFNKQTGVHFYTADNAEYLNVKKNLSAIYKYDGPAYNVRLTPDGVLGVSLPIFRFYNGATNAHFYTANIPEINASASLANIYKFEGIGFYTGGWQTSYALQYDVGELTDGALDDNPTIVPADETVGSIIGDARQTVVKDGYGLSVEASAAVDYSFVGWAEGLSTETTRTDGPITAPVTYTAVFEATP